MCGSAEPGEFISSWEITASESCMSVAFDHIAIAAISARLKNIAIYQKLMNELIQRAVSVRAKRRCVPRDNF
jgi:hypothetical protein